MSQLRSLYLDLTVEQNLLFFGRMYGLGPERLAERVAAEVERFQLGTDLRRLLGSLPTGVQRRCSLAVALLHEPKLLILDEPTSGMDTTSRREFWAFLGGLVAAETTVILTTHHLEEVQVCDRLCLMLAGRLHFEGTPGGMVEAFPGPVLLVSADQVEERPPDLEEGVRGVVARRPHQDPAPGSRPGGGAAPAGGGRGHRGPGGERGAHPGGRVRAGGREALICDNGRAPSSHRPDPLRVLGDAVLHRTHPSSLRTSYSRKQQGIPGPSGGPAGP